MKVVQSVIKKIIVIEKMDGVLTEVETGIEPMSLISILGNSQA